MASPLKMPSIRWTAPIITPTAKHATRKLYFRNGELQQVFGFDGERTDRRAAQIIPEAGDTFTVLEKWMDLNQSGEVAQFVNEQGKTLTFGDEAMTWVDLDAAAGRYVVGFLVEDLDGNQYPTYTTITVRGAKDAADGHFVKKQKDEG